MELVQPVQMKIDQINSYRKEFGWLYFDDEPRVQENQWVKGRDSYILISVAHLRFPNNCYGQQHGYDSSIPCKVIWQLYTDKEQHQGEETLYNESRDSFS